MAKGGVSSFQGLIDQVGDNSSVDGALAVAPGGQLPISTRSVPIDDLAANPHNPRDSVGDLEELRSIVDFQLQPVVVVTRAAYQALYPETDVAQRWVVVIGNRRLAAATKFGRPELDIVVRDELARDHQTLLTAVIAENVDRSGFDVIEEAKAVDQLVQMFGTATAAAEHLRKSKGWVSQRCALLKLAPELQESLRAGDLAVREARTLASVPHAEQVERWRRTAEGAAKGGEQGAADEAGDKGRVNRKTSSSSAVRAVTRALRKADADPTALAMALRDFLGDSGARALTSSLRKVIK